MLSEKFPKKVKVRQIAREAESVGGKFPQRNGWRYIISKGLKKGFRGWSGVVGFFHWPWICRLSQVNWLGLQLYWGRGKILTAFIM
jgi:hypothetical protein